MLRDFDSVLKSCDFLARHALSQFDAGNVQKRFASMIRQRSDAEKMMMMSQCCRMHDLCVSARSTSYCFDQMADAGFDCHKEEHQARIAWC